MPCSLSEYIDILNNPYSFPCSLQERGFGFYSAFPLVSSPRSASFSVPPFSAPFSSLPVFFSYFLTIFDCGGALASHRDNFQTNTCLLHSIARRGAYCRGPCCTSSTRTTLPRNYRIPYPIIAHQFPLFFATSCVFARRAAAAYGQLPHPHRHDLSFAPFSAYGCPIANSSMNP